MNPTSDFAPAVNAQQALIVRGENGADIQPCQRRLIEQAIADAAKYKRLEVILTGNAEKWELSYRAVRPLHGTIRLGLGLRIANILGMPVNFIKNDYEPLPRAALPKPVLG